MICKTVRYTSTDDRYISAILSILPERYAFAYSRLSHEEKKSISEIRIRAGCPCSFTSLSGNIVMHDVNGREIRSDEKEIELIVQRACEDSVYSQSESIKNGYISFGGVRIGLCGSGTVIDGTYTGQRNITSLSVRIPTFSPDAADGVLGYIRQKGLSKVMGILAVSPPGMGKTTFLKAFAKGISDTGVGGFSKRVCIIDERGELYDKANMRNCLCDVISGVPKLTALEMAIRTMSPEVVVFDEIGSEKETELLCAAYSGGVYIAASVHGKGLSDIMYGKGLRNAFSKGVFRTVYLMKENAAQGQGEITDVSERTDF
ncbi:MAG: hypothetical protein E7583_02845 [Ruminococcaceae bacterium]|nr:hypothetical protein [Oscillospiraceae bacterium]